MYFNVELFNKISAYAYKSVYFCYLDLMGYKSIITKYKDKAPEWIYTRVRQAINGNESLYKEIEIKLLSDSILIWTSSDNYINFLNLLNVIELICQSFLTNGVLTRGGVVIGNHFIENDGIVSEALIKAYTLESEIAVYPRIVIEEGLFKQIFFSDTIKNEISGKKVLQENGIKRLVIMEPYIQDFDGFYIINPIWYDSNIYNLVTGKPIWYIDGDKMPEPESVKQLWDQSFNILLKTKEIIRSGLIENRDNQRVKSKYTYMFKKFEQLILNSYLSNAEQVQLLVDLRQFA